MYDMIMLVVTVLAASPVVFTGDSNVRWNLENEYLLGSVKCPYRSMTDCGKYNVNLLQNNPIIGNSIY